MPTSYKPIAILLLLFFFAMPDFVSASTFGYTTQGGSAINIASDPGTNTATRQGTGATLSENGSITMISANLSSVTTSETLDLTVFINDRDSGGLNIHDEVMKAQRVSVGITTTKTWYDFSPTPTELISDNYIISAVGDPNDLGGSGTVNMSYDITGSPYRLTENFTTTPYTSAQEDPWTDDDSGSIFFSIYATYTASGGGGGGTEGV